jgi:protocatechuate 3,4-dioxygenase beta subunit
MQRTRTIQSVTFEFDEAGHLHASINTDRIFLGTRHYDDDKALALHDAIVQLVHTFEPDTFPLVTNTDWEK